MQGRATLLSTPASDPIAAAASAIDANTAPILTLNLSTCTGDLAQSDVDSYRALFRQANAQGITILATDSCATGDTSASQPSLMLSLPEVTALTVAPDASLDSTLNLTEARPGWQVAPGLPADALRHQPDLTTASATAFNQTLANILTSTGTSQGNINSTLYSLATSPGLYTQPDDATPGTWEPSTGLGLVDLTVLAKVYPRAGGINATTTSLVSSTYSLTYGQPFTFTATVLPSTYAALPPSGTVTFSSSTQGVIGTATVTSSGSAVLNVATALHVGAYNLTASYGGDSNYSGSTSTSSVVVTVSIVNAALNGDHPPTTNVPYGSTATVTATVTLPGATAAPSGTVTAVVEGVTGASASNTLTPNPGGNTATANITFGVPPRQRNIWLRRPGHLRRHDQLPVSVTRHSPFVTVKGNTTSTSPPPRWPRRPVNQSRSPQTYPPRVTVRALYFHR